MRVGIIGSGRVGGTLGVRWGQSGHQVILGTRRPESPEITELLGKSGGNARAASTPEAVAESDILLLASPWPATEEMIRSAGDLSGKVLIDATNPFKPDLSGMTSDIVTSGGELVASWAKGAKVVKAFNSIGFPIMDNPAFGDARAVLLYCGDDGQAKAQVHQLAADLGFQPQDLGPLSLSAALEYTALTWVTLAFKQGFGPQFAFQLLRR